MKWFTKTDVQPKILEVVRLTSVTPRIASKVGLFSAEGDSIGGSVMRDQMRHMVYGSQIVSFCSAEELDNMIEALSTYRDLVAKAKEDGAQ